MNRNNQDPATLVLPEPMTTDDFSKLAVGDIVRHRLANSRFVVTANYGGRVTAVQTADITSPSEWALVSKAMRFPD